MIKHQVNHHSSDGNVKPHRKRPTRDALMLRKPAAGGSIDRHQDERNDYGCEHRMRSQDREINWAHETLPCKPGCAVMKMVDDVGDEKQRGGRQRRKLAVAMRRNIVSPDEKVTRRQEY